MNPLPKALKYLDFTPSQMEEVILIDWLRWCEGKSYSNTYAKATMNGQLIFVQRNDADLQNLLADSSLYKFWLDVYLDCLMEFVETCDDMNPKPNKEEAIHIYRTSMVETHRVFSKSLLDNARTKKIVEHVRS